MSEAAIEIKNLGKMYKLFKRPGDKVCDAFGLNKVLFWRKKRYQEFWALRGLSVVFRKGERVGIIGRNGAGKSTLLKIITGNVSATEGEVRINGRVQALMELGTGFHPEFTGIQNIRASLAYQGLESGRISELVDEIVEFAEIGSFIDQPIKTYSAGMYARLAFSVATVIEPEILIIDEVLGAGDAYFAGKCLERMKKLTEDSGATVLFVSHDLGSVQRFCERVIWIDRGRIVCNGHPLGVTKKYYASILEQEEKRLQAKNSKGRSGSAGNRELTFRLATGDGGPPGKSHPVRAITLTGPGGYSQSVEPGTPMDNDRSHTAYILTDTEYMNWGSPRLFNGLMARAFEDVGGKNRHAPVVFRVPQECLEEQGGRGFSLEITHMADPGEPVYLELYRDNEYRRLGRLKPGEGAWATDIVEAPLSKEPVETGAPSSGVQNDAGVKDKWGGPECEFMRISPVDGGGKEKVIFSLGEDFGFRIRAEIKRRLPCWVVIVIYDSAGSRVCLITEDLGTIGPGRKDINVVFSRANLRQGEYIASFCLQPSYDPTSLAQHPYYALWNRCVSFKVDEGYVGSIALGVVELKGRIIMEEEKDERGC